MTPENLMSKTAAISRSLGEALAFWRGDILAESGQEAMNKLETIAQCCAENRTPVRGNQLQHL